MRLELLVYRFRLILLLTNNLSSLKLFSHYLKNYFPGTSWSYRKNEYKKSVVLKLNNNFLFSQTFTTNKVKD